MKRCHESTVSKAVKPAFLFLTAQRMKRSGVRLTPLEDCRLPLPDCSADEAYWFFCHFLLLNRLPLPDCSADEAQRGFERMKRDVDRLPLPDCSADEA